MADQEPLSFNGVNASTGAYLTAPMSAREVIGLAAGTPRDADHQRELEARNDRDTKPNYAPIAGVDPKDLAQTGWGVIFPQDSPAGVRDALRPLLDHRRAQAGRAKEQRYKEYAGPTGYWAADPSESKRKFLARNKAAVGMPADPDRVPYYLMIVAPPDVIPYRFQYQLDVEYAVGRLWFETADGKPDLAAFAQYARSVIAAETGQVSLPRTATLVGVQNDDDPATNLSADYLIKPLPAAVASSVRGPAWQITQTVKAGAKKADLAGLLNGPAVPAVLFTASHGLGFAGDDPRQRHHQGALLCQDWPGPRAWGRRPIPADHYLAADDVAGSAKLLGLVAFHFACYGLGTPQFDDFPHLQQLLGREEIAPQPFVARLPQRLLGHPNGGALAVVGHVERAWSCSFYGGDKLGAQLQAFQSTLAQLLDGYPVGYAMEFFNQLYASLSTVLSSDLEEAKYGVPPDEWALASAWTANNDARSYLVFGDPAVRVAAAAEGTATVRPVIEPAAVPPPAPTPAPKAAAESFGPTPPPPGPPAVTATVVPGETITVTVPVRIAIRVGPAAEAGTVVGAESFGKGGAAIDIDPDYSDREGYDPEFLGGDLRVDLPVLSAAQRKTAARVTGADPGADPFELKYHHFSVVLNAARRLAEFTAVNIDGRTKNFPDRANDRWAYDPRVDRAAQLGNDFYGRPFDRGHLVRRLDPAWGRAAGAAKRANDDTFHWSNCSPQHWRFNEGKNLWAGLEDYLLDKAGAERRRLTVFTGPVFAAADPAYEGVRIPKRFWKVAVLARGGRLFALGFLVSQEALLRQEQDIAFGPAEVAKTFQVPVAAVAAATGLGFGQLTTLDAGSMASFAPGAPAERPLVDFTDIRIPG